MSRAVHSEFALKMMQPSKFNIVDAVATAAEINEIRDYTFCKENLKSAEDPVQVLHMIAERWDTKLSFWTAPEILHRNTGCSVSELILGANFLFYYYQTDIEIIPAMQILVNTLQFLAANPNVAELLEYYNGTNNKLLLIENDALLDINALNPTSLNVKFCGGDYSCCGEYEKMLEGRYTFCYRNSTHRGVCTLLNISIKGFKIKISRKMQNTLDEMETILSSYENSKKLFRIKLGAGSNLDNWVWEKCNETCLYNSQDENDFLQFKFKPKSVLPGIEWFGSNFRPFSRKRKNEESAYAPSKKFFVKLPVSDQVSLAADAVVMDEIRKLQNTKTRNFENDNICIEDLANEKVEWSIQELPSLEELEHPATSEEGRLEDDLDKLKSFCKLFKNMFRNLSEDELFQLESPDHAHNSKRMQIIYSAEWEALDTLESRIAPFGDKLKTATLQFLRPGSNLSSDEIYAFSFLLEDLTPEGIIENSADFQQIPMDASRALSSPDTTGPSTSTQNCRKSAGNLKPKKLFD